MKCVKTTYFRQGELEYVGIACLPDETFYRRLSGYFLVSKIEQINQKTVFVKRPQYGLFITESQRKNFVQEFRDIVKLAKETKAPEVLDLFSLSYPIQFLSPDIKFIEFVFDIEYLGELNYGDFRKIACEMVDSMLATYGIERLADVVWVLGEVMAKKLYSTTL